MNPYENLPDKAFWKLTVGTNNPLELGQFWDPKFPIEPSHRISTFGSCFAQYIGAALKDRNYNWHCAENAPPNLSESNKLKYNFELFSARTGNIYTTTLFKQWVDWALGFEEVPDEVWEKDGRFYDPFRPLLNLGAMKARMSF